MYPNLKKNTFYVQLEIQQLNYLYYSIYKIFLISLKCLISQAKISF